MDKRVLRERMRRKKRQMMIRHYTKIGLCVIGMILAVVFVVRGIIIPIAHHVAGGGSSDQTVQAQADTEEVQANSDAAVRQPLNANKQGKTGLAKAGLICSIIGIVLGIIITILAAVFSVAFMSELTNY